MSAPTSARSLRPLATTFLQPGMILPASVLDETGRRVLPGGADVTAQARRLVERRCGAIFYVDHEWPEELSARADSSDAVIKTLASRHAPRGPQQREHERHSWTVSLSLTLIERSTAGARERHLDVVTHDISRGGFSFVARCYVHPGTVVSARVEALPNRPVLRGVVRNCAHIRGSDHRVGVQFLAEESADPGTTAA